jgi:hypothetical protein
MGLKARSALSVQIPSKHRPLARSDQTVHLVQWGRKLLMQAQMARSDRWVQIQLRPGRWDQMDQMDHSDLIQWMQGRSVPMGRLDPADRLVRIPLTLVRSALTVPKGRMDRKQLRQGRMVR